MSEASSTISRAWYSSRLFELSTLILCAFIAKIAATALSPLQESVRLAFALTDNQMAMLQGPALALPMVALALPIGILIDHSSRVRLILFMALVVAAGSVVTMTSSSFAMLFIGRCLVGFASSTIIIIGFSLLADWYPPERRGKMKAVLVLGQYAGTSAAFAAGGKLLSAFDAASGWRWALFWLTIPALALASLLVVGMREPSRTGVVKREPPSRAIFAELWQYRLLVAPAMLGIILAEIPIFAVISWAAPAFIRSYSLSPSQVGGLLGVALLVGGLLGPIGGGTLADICQKAGGPRRTMSAISVLVCVSAPLGMFAVMPNPTLAVICVTIFFTVTAAAVNMGATLFTIIIPNELRGLCLSIMTAGVSLVGIMMAPLAVSLLSGAMGGPAMISKALAIVCVAGSIASALAFGLGRKSMSSSTAL